MPDAAVDPAARDKYLLQVTAGPSYDVSTHREVAVNGPDAHIIDNDVMTCWLKVKIRDYHGLPRNSPATDDYFSHPLHKSDRYSVGFSFVPKNDIKGSDLVTGFDFDHPIRDRLPPGFKYAMKIVTTLLDPGLFGDPYSDRPYLYGPGLSSFFSFRIGEHVSDVSADDQLATFANDAKSVIEEGADGSGQRIRADQHIPAKTNKRRKNFLDPKKLDDFTFEAGRMYQADFFNPYLDFANFALRIPGFSISVVRYIDDKTHQLRFVLKKKSTDEVLFVVIFNLLFGQNLEETLANKEQPNPSKTESRNATFATTDGNTESTPPSPTFQPPTSRSSYETTPPSGASSAPDSDLEDDPVKKEERQTAAMGLASSIYSGFAALGFGRTASSSSESSVGSAREKEKNKEKDKNKEVLNGKVDSMKDRTVESYLKSKSSSV
ncbi:DUF1769-domain-containing protein [Melanomma pulvis-pyrius CBS 109.77]|uniref:DUF1769-domain-containing protein n=1 Tax=Melanomma pulvis-pyrius CBS 109.77 TaxID=1314802 RepID=A0A6A6XRV3_9PLEO|nr:DUF1769-domain-containing protein [Melanomma pulvis-pyrius CBS 109.77]